VDGASDSVCELYMAVCREAVGFEKGRKGVSGVRGEHGDGGIERWLGLKGVGLILSGPLVLDCGIMKGVCRC
jgi:hypothetical protein